METTPIEITLGDGSVVKADSMDEAFRTVAKMKEDTAAALREARDENERLAQELEHYRAQSAPHEEAPEEAEAPRAPRAAEARPAAPWSRTGFDRELYFRMLNDDPVAAQNYLDAVRFGIPNPAAVPAAFSQLQEQVSAITQQSIASAFLAQHYDDYSNSPENNRALRFAVEQLCAQGFPFSLDTMNYAYNRLVEEGVMKKMERGEDHREAANPPLRGMGSSHEESEALRAEQMSTPELEALLRSKGMLR